MAESPANSCGKRIYFVDSRIFGCAPAGQMALGMVFLAIRPIALAGGAARGPIDDETAAIVDLVVDEEINVDRRIAV